MKVITNTTFLSNKIDIWLKNWTSENTRQAYKSDLQEFLTFLQKQNCTLDDLDLNTTIKYRDTLQSIGQSPNTTARKLASIKSFMSWALEVGHIETNPIASLKIPKATVTRPTTALTDEEVKKMLTIPNNKTFHGNLHLMVLRLLFNLGLRRSEITHIRLQDIFEDRGYTVLKITGKGQKDRCIPLSTDLWVEICAYLYNYKAFAHKELLPQDFLLQTQCAYTSDKPVNSNTINKIVKRYAKVAGIAKRVSAHSCRATAISHLLDTQNVPIRDVADFAGHSSINTTSLYDKKRKGYENSAAYKIHF